ncbi:Vesicle transport v-SNARE 13 [Linum perenne]
MSQVFEGYERQYCELSANLSRRCTSASVLDGEQKKQKISEIRTGLDDADALIRKMDMEARSLPPNIKASLLSKIREYKSDLNNLKNEIKRMSSSNFSQGAARDELLEYGMADTKMVSTDQRGRLLVSTDRLNQSTDRIKDSRRTMLETEELGVSILQDLHQQRQALLHANNTVYVFRLSQFSDLNLLVLHVCMNMQLHGVDDNIGRSKRILTAMSRRMDRNKWIVGCIVAALILAILVILYFKLFH